MRRSDRYIVYFFSALADAVIIAATFAVVSQIRVGTITGVQEQLLSDPRWQHDGPYVICLYALLLPTVYALLHTYGDVFYGRISRMARKVLAVDTVGIALFTAVLFIIRLGDFSRWILLTFYLASTFLVILKHWVEIQILYRYRRSKHRDIPVIVVGSGALAQEYADLMATDPTRFERVLGYVAADEGTKVPTQGDPRHGELTVRLGYTTHVVDPKYLGPCLGTVADLDKILETTEVAQLVIALEAENYAHARTATVAADKHGTFVRIVPFYGDLIPRNPALESVQDLTLVDVRTTALDNLFAAALKRIFDIMVSALVLVIISPILLITAIGVKVSSPGPVLFKQERIGKNKKPFMMLKFRSMRVNAESATAWSTDEDPRKTKFGSFIRKYSIDELPQFINVLKGDMSIVGPRPEIPHYVREFQEEVPLYMLRHQVRPGITGWAQVNGLRGNTSIEERVKYDLYYIEHWSPWFDLKIFFRTIFGGFMNNEKLVK